MEMIQTETAVQPKIEFVLPDERKEQIAGVTGEDAGTIRAVQLDIRRMKELGILVDIDVHGTSLFTVRASWAELGIPEDDTRRKRLKRGSKDLIPKEYLGKLRSLETRFRQSLDKHSFDLEGFRPYRWVPFTAYEEWRTEWDRLQAELAELKAKIINHYDEFVDAIAADFATIAREAWDAIRARRPAGAGEFALITDHGTFDGLDAFIDHVVARATAKLPSPERIEAELYVDYKNALVATGADVEAELLARDQLHTKREIESAKQKLAQEQAHTERKAEWAKQDQLHLEVAEAEKLSQIRVEEERVKLAAMRAAELEHARKQIENTVNPFQEVIEQFRSQIFQDVGEIAASIKKNGHVRGKVAERARGLLDTYRLLGAATGDDELEDALGELHDHLNGSAPLDGETKYNTGDVVGALKEIAELTHEAAQTVAQRAGAHTRAGALEL